MSANGITVDQLVAEWRKIESPPDGGGMTTSEIAEALNMNENAVRKILKTAMAEGKVRNEQQVRYNPFRGGRKYHANVFVVVE